MRKRRKKYKPKEKKEAIRISARLLAVAKKVQTEERSHL
jgi:hypothetical protein